MSSYTSLEAELHDPFWEAEGPSAELPLLRRFLSHFAGTSLEIGSGSGRLLIPLLLEGYDVEGLEPSSDMLALCRKKAAVVGLEPVLHASGMETFHPENTYAALLIPAFTLQLASDPSQTLKRLASWVRPEGGLYLTVFRPDAELDGDLPEGVWYPDHEVRLPDGRIGAVETKHRIDSSTRVLHREHRYHLLTPERALHSSHSSTQTLRWFDHGELHRMLLEAGFEHFEGIAEFEETFDFPSGDDPQIMTIVARRSE